MLTFQSLECQDKFVYTLLSKTNNTSILSNYNSFFLDISCCHPVLSNNTYIFENTFGWDGIGVDLLDYADCCGPFAWK
jgi:hypothetical protein